MRRNTAQMLLPPSMAPGVVQRLRHSRKLDAVIASGTPVPTGHKAKPCGKYHKRRKTFAMPSEAQCIVARRYGRTMSHLEHKAPTNATYD